jgi:hypothetical protein
MPRCKGCKEKFETFEFNNKYCKKSKCQKIHKDILIDKQTKKALNNLKKIKKDKTAKLRAKVYPKGKSDQLQTAVNKLSKMIDKACGYSTCIDCDKPLGTTHGAHFGNVASHANIRYNLHNLHSARAHCNMYSSEHKKGYTKGLVSRYSEDYLEFVEFTIRHKYKLLKLSGDEYKHALKNVRLILREFDSYTLKDGIVARRAFNIEIGIYSE